MMLRTQTQVKQRPNHLMKKYNSLVRTNRNRSTQFSKAGFPYSQQPSEVNIKNFEVKPRLLESSLSQRKEFHMLSDGFKQIFAQDQDDEKIVLPISGYGGHRRGDRSQNFFGKSFRDSSLQSKKLQRFLRSPTRQ